MSSPTLSRRVFLKGSGGVLAGTLAFASSPIALLAPSRSWAMPLNTLTTRQGETLLEVVKQMFPHPGLEDAVYAYTVKSLDSKAEDGEIYQLLDGGIETLDDSSGGDWLGQGEQKRMSQLTAIANTPFFQLVRANAVVSLYDNPLAYAHFGYGGSEGDFGYINKGFNDLTWLPDPPKPEGGYLPTEPVS